MPLIVDFIVPQRPVSHQAKDSATKVLCKNYVYGPAMQAWPAEPFELPA
jgi:hypothetical protein